MKIPIEIIAIKSIVLVWHKFRNYVYFVREAAIQRCSVKSVFLEISQNSQENTCARVSFLIKLLASFFKEHLRWLLLLIQSFPLQVYPLQKGVEDY